MVRTIKDKPLPTLTARQGELLPAGGSLQDFLNGLNGNQKMELANHVTNVIQEGLRAFNAAEQRRALEEQYHRDIKLSDNEVVKARIDLEKFAEQCRVELAHIDREAEDARAARAHRAEHARDYRQLARDSWARYVETGDAAALHVMQQAMLAANQA